MVVQGFAATMVSQHSSVASMAVTLQGYSAAMASQGSQTCSHASIIELQGSSQVNRVTAGCERGCSNRR